MHLQRPNDTSRVLTHNYPVAVNILFTSSLYPELRKIQEQITAYFAGQIPAYFTLKSIIAAYAITKPAITYPAAVSAARRTAYGAVVLTIRIFETPVPAEVINTGSA